ncbi:GyrI-like domain-containing protein [uncultured Tateyamaria sp.]|uniref:GyrI-like domain-containing protein n=1 Tax=uncultured Tateyamaria sp. TaxID=455651 RepID=UPI002626D3E7|nr:GyrI-like domain-containing protein [uncultured Tateyamaria sp.]
MAELVSLDTVTLGGVVETVPFADRLRLIPNIFGRLDAAIGQAGFFYVGPQTALYRIEGDQMEVRAGVPLDAPLPGFEMFEAPGSEALMHRHRGGFDGLAQVYQDLSAEIANLGRMRGTWAREIYRQVARNADLNVVDVYIDVTKET